MYIHCTIVLHFAKRKKLYFILRTIIHTSSSSYSSFYTYTCLLNLSIYVSILLPGDPDRGDWYAGPFQAVGLGGLRPARYPTQCAPHLLRQPEDAQGRANIHTHTHTHTRIHTLLSKV